MTGKLSRRSLLAGVGLSVGGVSGASAQVCSGNRFEIKKSGEKNYSWTLYARNGEAVASHQHYNSKRDCIDATDRLLGIAAGAEVSFLEECE